MWLAIFGAVLIGCIAAIVFLVRQIHWFSPIQKLAEKHRVLSWAAAAGILSLTGLTCFINVWAMAIVLLHLALIWLICFGAAAIVRRVRGAERRGSPEGVVAVLLTAVYLGSGWYNAHHVVITRYTLEKPAYMTESLRAAEIADLHLGITLDGEQFAKELDKLKSEQPDILVLTGDFVDDDSKRADMVTACEALGHFETKYGTYFIFGNHDEGYGNYRDFTVDDLRAELEKNGVVILEDETADLDGFYLTGRKDAYADRAPMSELCKGLDPEKYHIVLDHQPNDFADEAEAGADLVLSGHTHGGHLFPAGYIGVLIGANDRFYGYEKRGRTNFIVSSGISGWAIPFKTGALSEIVVIDVG